MMRSQQRMKWTSNLLFTNIRLKMVSQEGLGVWVLLQAMSSVKRWWFQESAISDDDLRGIRILRRPWTTKNISVFDPRPKPVQLTNFVWLSCLVSSHEYWPFQWGFDLSDYSAQAMHASAWTMTQQRPWILTTSPSWEGDRNRRLTRPSWKDGRLTCPETERNLCHDWPSLGLN